MAKEGDIKRVELKVSVHCCDGCKKKVKKILRSTEGVLNVEIDTLEPRVTILGNVEPQNLIKKLLKVGKHAEIWSYKNQNDTKENKESTISASIKSDKESFASGSEKTSHSETRPATSTEKHTESVASKEGEGNTASGSEKTSHSEARPATSTEKHTESVASKEGEGNTAVDHKDANYYGTSGMVKTGNPILYQPQASCAGIHPSILTHDGACKFISSDTQQFYYMVEPARGPVVLPYCAVYPYKAPPIYTSSTEVYNNVGIMLEPLVQIPAPTTLGDYFNDENTVGCQIM